MEQLQVHEKFTIPDARVYKGVIAEYDLNNGNTLELWVNIGYFWINEFEVDGIMTDRKFDTTTTYDDGMKLLINMGEEINAE